MKIVFLIIMIIWLLLSVLKTVLLLIYVETDFFWGEFFDESKIQKSSIYLKIVVTL